MNQKLRETLIRFIYIILDILSLALAIFTAASLRQSSLEFSVTFYDLFLSSDNPFRIIFLFWVLIAVFLNNNYGLYRTKRELLEGIEIWRVIKSVFLSTLIIIVAIYLAKLHSFPRSIVGWIFFFTCVLFSSWRIGKRFLVDGLVAGGYNNFNTFCEKKIK